VHLAQVIAIKWIVTAVGIYVFSFLFGKRVQMRGLTAALTVALLIAPANVFLKEIATQFGLPTSRLVLFILNVVLNGVLLYAATYIVPDFRVESLSVAVALALLISAMTLALAYYFEEPTLLPGYTSIGVLQGSSPLLLPTGKTLRAIAFVPISLEA
jgi:uncharacterized membrane protein YvlD (DUF360 family)